MKKHLLYLLLCQQCNIKGRRHEGTKARKIILLPFRTFTLSRLRAFVLSCLTLLPLFVSAQHQLTSQHNLPRPGDEIIKRQVEYKDPGRSSENVLWDFGTLQSRNDGYRLSYILSKDSLLAGIEHRTFYYHALTGDSLLLRGYENSTTLMKNEQPELLLRFPVHYGDSTFCYYNGNGKYCDRLKISAMGTVWSKADAHGMMILPGGDTLKNVLRIRTIKRIAEKIEPLLSYNLSDSIRSVASDSIEYRLANDTLLFGVETCRWYAKGYRYPIFETVKSITDKHGKENTFFDTAFFYPPDEHSYLDDDPENLALLEEEEPDDPQNLNPWAGLTYNFYPNPVINDLNIEIYMPKPGHVQMQLTSRPGLIVWTKDFGIWPEGIHATSIFMGGFPLGEYVLNMWFDDYMIGEIIIKK